MIDLHDSHGRHIANFVSGQLHDVQGEKHWSLFGE